MIGSLEHQPIHIQDDSGRLMRSIDFAPLDHQLAVQDTSGGIGLRDVWDLNPKVQLDLNLRFDASGDSRVASRGMPVDVRIVTVPPTAGSIV